MHDYYKKMKKGGHWYKKTRGKKKYKEWISTHQPNFSDFIVKGRLLSKFIGDVHDYCILLSQYHCHYMWLVLSIVCFCSRDIKSALGSIWISWFYGRLKHRLYSENYCVSLLLIIVYWDCQLDCIHDCCVYFKRQRHILSCWCLCNFVNLRGIYPRNMCKRIMYFLLLKFKPSQPPLMCINVDFN